MSSEIGLSHNSVLVLVPDNGICTVVKALGEEGKATNSHVSANVDAIIEVGDMSLCDVRAEAIGGIPGATLGVNSNNRELLIVRNSEGDTYSTSNGGMVDEAAGPSYKDVVNFYPEGDIHTSTGKDV